MKIAVLLLLFICVNLKGFCQVQTDTLWFDADWQNASKEEAEYYRPPLVKENYWYVVKDYFINGQVQMKGHSIMADSIVFEGLFQWFDKKGNVEKTSNYTQGRLEGESVVWINGKKYKSIYKNNKFYNGTVFYQNSGGYYKLESVDGSLTNQKTFFDKNYKHLKVEEFYDSNKITGPYSDVYLINYYRLDGSKVGQTQYSENGEVNGVYVNYYDEDLGGDIFSIQYMKEGKLSHTDLFYGNGNPKSIGVKNEGLTMKYYKENGELLDSVIYKDNYPFKGCQILFYNSKESVNSSQLKIKSWYEKGNLVKRVQYHINGNIESIIHYEDLFNIKKSETKYDENEIKLSHLEFKNGNPFNGIKISNYDKIWYENGKKVKVLQYYLDGKTVFKERILNKVTFYSLEQDVIGELQKDTVYGSSNVNGLDIVLNGNDLYKITEYQETKIIKEIIYNKEKGKTYKKEAYFENVNGYSNKIKELDYYSDGNLKSEITFSKGYNKKKANYYNTEGTVVGSYDFEKKHGVNYAFFGYTGEIESIKTLENGKLVKELLYKKVYNENDSDEYSIVLIRNIDVNAKGIFYKDNGQLLSEISFRNKKPFTGRVYDDYRRESVDFLEGQKHGKHFVYRVPGMFVEISSEVNYVKGKKEGIKKKYNYNGELEKTEMYKNDNLNGEVVRFLKDGSKTKVVYKNNRPFEGDVVDMSYGEKKVLKRYHNGDLVYKIKYLSNGNLEYQYTQESVEVQMYFPESDVVKYRFNQELESNRITGAVVRYNKKGKEIHRAILNKNKLVSGEIWLKSDNYGTIPVDHCLKVMKTEIDTELKLFDKTNELQFAIKERNDFEYPIISKRLQYNLDYITEERLY